MRRAVSAILMAAGVLAASSALAQQRGPATDGARGGERPAMLTTEDRAALVDARIAALRTGLRLTPEQEKNWPAVESAIRDLAKQRGQVRERMREARESRDPIATASHRGRCDGRARHRSEAARRCLRTALSQPR